MGLFEAALIDVGIDLRGRNVGVTEHFLDNTQIGPIVEQMRGEAMPQRVRSDILRDASPARVFLDQQPDGLGTERRAAG